MSSPTDEFNDGLLSSADVRTGFISGVTFRNKPVQYSVVDGLAILEGCIVIGTVEEVEQHAEMVRSGQDYSDQADDLIAHGVYITGDKFRWPDAVVPYEIANNLPNQSRVTDSITHWESNTNVRFVLRTSANASQYSDYVRFIPASGCWSQIGRRGGKQDIGLASGCTTGNCIHEIAHAMGLYHEQSREDRDQHVVIHWENIETGREHNFNQHITDGDDYGPYDYDSIMHYPTWAFSRNNQPTITTIPPGIPIGQRNGLSAGDIATIHGIYQTWHRDLTVTATYATYHSKNAWVALSGMGWRKIQTNSTDGVTNMFAAFCEALAKGRKVNALADGFSVFRLELI